jgi:hypothetical protein
MATQRINFSEWTPDQPSVAGTLLDVNNAVPLQVGYGIFPQAVDYSNAASESLNNVYAGKFSNITELFAGGASKLFKYNTGTRNLTNVSKTGGYSGERWEFVQFGDALLATNNAQKIQAWYVNTSSAFADVAATAPVCKYITVVRDFVVAANISGTPNKLQWCDINDETNWTSGAASQSDFQIISDGGNIRGITGGEFGLILMERGIVRMSYVGSPYFFQFDTISRGLGCLSGSSVAQYASVTYFLSDDGFYSCDGTSLVGIGTEKVDRYFFGSLDLNNIDTISTAVDPIRNIVLWNYPNVSGGRSIIMYNWQLKKWSKADTTVDYISSVATSGMTLEDLDGIGALDDLTTSLDSRLYIGGKFLFAGVKSTKIVTFTGARTTATFTVGDIEQGYNSTVQLARPLIQDGSANIKVSSRKEIADTVTYGSSVTTSTEGRCPLRSSGRFHRIEVTPTGNWTNAVWVDIDFADRGTR